MLLRRTVVGPLVGPVRKTANRTSFHSEVNCQMSVTANAGAELGRTTDQ